MKMHSYTFLKKMGGTAGLLCMTLTILVFSCGEKKPLPPGQPVLKNEKDTVIIELVTTPDSLPEISGLKELAGKSGFITDSIFNWKNHFVFFGVIPDPQEMSAKLRQAYPGSEVRIYNAPFYIFNRKQCPDSAKVPEWTPVLLTASLVADTTLQQEYLSYHASQFEKWPEVRAGFCHAGFQQLLLFKNGRQLMLVISIPKGKILQELDPKTTEHNPRVVEWNTLMKKYQEGIPGTAKNETWVFLDPVIVNKKN